MNTVPLPVIEVPIPHEVVAIEDELDCGLIRAWREPGQNHLLKTVRTLPVLTRLLSRER